MREIIEQLDKADQDIRKKLSEETCGLSDARKKEILMQVRESVQKAITLLLSMPG